MTVLENFFTRLGAESAVLVAVDAVQGSAPREPGAWMAVFADGALGSIGGGHLEWQAQQLARQHLVSDAPSRIQRFALGPSLGQCCGGQVHLRFERVSAQDWPQLQPRLQPQRANVVLFGGGHVGQALARLLRELPMQLHWIDSRDEIFPQDMPSHVVCEHSDPVQAAVPGLRADSCVLIMSFSHAEDLEVLAACLKRHREQADLPYLGLIGSRSKWASFKHRLLERGFTEQELDHVTCPIGVPGISGKQPEVIAVAVAAQLLQILSHRSASCSPT